MLKPGIKGITVKAQSDELLEGKALGGGVRSFWSIGTVLCTWVVVRKLLVLC